MKATLWWRKPSNIVGIGILGLLLITAITIVTPRLIPTNTDPCVISMRDAAAERDSTKADALILDTTEECPTAEAWLSALTQYPRAMGITNAENIVPRTQLSSVCLGNMDSRVCVDAIASGIDLIR